MCTKKRIVVCVLVVLGIGATCYFLRERAAEQGQTFFSRILMQHDRPTNGLLGLLKQLGVEHNGTLDSIVSVTQKAWLRKPGLERWEMENSCKGQEGVLLPYFEKLWLQQEIKPCRDKYDYLLLMGATCQGMRERLSYAIQLWNQGVRFNTLVVLVGQRKLDHSIESKEILFARNSKDFVVRPDWVEPSEVPSVETEMAQLLFDQAEMPLAMAKIPRVFIDTPAQVNQQGVTVRPTTADTVAHWMKQQPKSGSCLVVSCQPHCGYFDATMRLLLPESFTHEVVGRSFNQEAINFSVVLDALARWLYQEKAIQDKNCISNR